MIVVCVNCGKFYNGAELKECPFCKSPCRRSPTGLEIAFAGIQDSKLPTCHGGVKRD